MNRFIDGLVWVPSAVITNPTNGQIMCDSGALQAGLWLFSIVGDCDVAIRYQVTAVNVAQLLADRRPAAGDIDWLQPSEVYLGPGEHVQATIVGNPSAIVQITLYGILTR